MKKKILALSLCVALLAVAVVGGTLAYFTDSDDATNVFTVGNVDIKLVEENWEKTGKIDAETVYPGEALAKDPVVENYGANPCFVRVKVDGLDQFGEKGNIIYRTNYVDNALGQDWVYNEADGFFYYTKPLAAAAEDGTPSKTSALFDQIVMPTGLVGTTNDETEAGTKSVDVTAYAVQAQGARARWADVEAMSATDIAAWFNTCAPAEWNKAANTNTTNPIENNDQVEGEEPAEDGEQPEAPQQ